MSTVTSPNRLLLHLSLCPLSLFNICGLCTSWNCFFKSDWKGSSVLQYTSVSSFHCFCHCHIMLVLKMSPIWSSVCCPLCLLCWFRSLYRKRWQFTVYFLKLQFYFCIHMLSYFSAKWCY